MMFEICTKQYRILEMGPCIFKTELSQSNPTFSFPNLTAYEDAVRIWAMSF